MTTPVRAARRLSRAAVAAFVALRAEQMEIVFGLDDDQPLSAFSNMRNFHIATVRSLYRRGYIAKIRNVTQPRLHLVETWVCGLTDAGKEALDAAR